MFDIFVMDMGGHDDNVSALLDRFPHAQVLRYNNSHLSMIKRAATKSRTARFWMIASCCDYSNFDFTWQPPAGQEKQIHCWASNNQSQGDTFLVPLDEFKKQETVELLEWYRDINYHSNGVLRLPWPNVYVKNDNLAQSVLDHQFAGLYANFYMPGTAGETDGYPSLWLNRPVLAFNRNGHMSMCPRDAKTALKTQIYDWPYIQYQDSENITQNLQDIVFISYDEKNAEENWSKLKDHHARAKRVHGVEGMVAAIKAAAEAASTPYFFAVFGKTEIVDTFKFDYQPDYLRHPANYVFHSYNPVLDYSYGHDGVVMYNTAWVKSVDAYDLDFTMSNHLVTVPEVSCINRYNASAWSAWRTAFRETYKLSYYIDKSHNTDDEYHLHLWLTASAGENGSWSRRGAEQGREFYLQQKEKQQFSINDWSWLKDKFNSQT